MTNIYWVYINRFDENISKIPRIEMAENLTHYSFALTLLTGFRKSKFYPNGYRFKLRYFNCLQHIGFFKITLSLSILYWSLKNVMKDDIVILSPGSLWIGAILKKYRKCKIHLDIRTIPVEINTTKARINYFFNWYIQLKLFYDVPQSYSFITKNLKQCVEKEFGISFNDFVLWQSGVNVDRFSHVRKNPKSHSSEFILTYLGVVTKSRGLDKVLRALAKMPHKYRKSIRFQIIGDGSYLPYLRQLTASLKISDNVIFKGYIPYESVPNYLQKTDCFICPLPEKLEWNISSPIKIFEYLACAKPLILTPISAHRNILNGENFVVWTEGYNVSHYERAIEYAFKKRINLAEAAKRAPDFVRNQYEWKIQAKKLRGYLMAKYF